MSLTAFMGANEEQPGVGSSGNKKQVRYLEASALLKQNHERTLYKKQAMRVNDRRINVIVCKDNRKVKESCFL